MKGECEECVKEIENERHNAQAKLKDCKCKQINNLMLPFNPH